MPEEPEIDTDKLHETIDEQAERGGGRLLKGIALTTALVAAAAAISALKAGATVNEALILKTEATRSQAEASDNWSYFQAKGIKAVVLEASRSAYLAAGKSPPPELADKIKVYQHDQQEIHEKAKDKEKERDEKSEEADHLLHAHHGFANTVALFQVAIALGAVAALTRSRLVWYGSLAMSLAGAVLLFKSFAG